MDNQEFKEKIKKIIKRGYDLKLISVELRIPVEELEMYKKEIEEEQKKAAATVITKKAVTTGDVIPYNKHSSILMLKENYYKLYSKKKGNNNFANKTRTLTQQEKERLEKILEELKQGLPEITKSSTDINKRKKLSKEFVIKLEQNADILPYFDKIEELYLLFEQDDLLYFDGLGQNVTKMRKIVSRIFAKSFLVKSQSTDDIKMLTQFLNKIRNIKLKGIAVESYEREIEAKLNKLIAEQKQKDRRNNETDEIKMIVQQLADGEVNMEEANKIIDMEAKRRYENSPKNKFSLTEEKQRKQVLMQLGQILSTQGEKYKIVNPEVTLNLLQTLCESKLELALSEVSNNLLVGYRFEEAKQLWQKYYIKDPSNLSIKLQRKKVKNAELSYLILKGIRETNSPTEEKEFYELLKNGLEMGNVKPENIDLGTNKEGSMKITLADILDEDKFLREGI